MSTITIRGLTKRFEQHVVLQDLSLTIPDGSFFTLLGPSGCGKTTLLRCIAGFNDPDGGSILFDDDDITRVPAHRRNIGMVFQDYALFPDKTVQDNVAYGLNARKVAADEVIALAHEALEQVGLRQYADRFPAQRGHRAVDVQHLAIAALQFDVLPGIAPVVVQRIVERSLQDRRTGAHHGQRLAGDRSQADRKQVFARRVHISDDQPLVEQQHGRRE